MGKYFDDNSSSLQLSSMGKVRQTPEYQQQRITTKQKFYVNEANNWLKEVGSLFDTDTSGYNTELFNTRAKTADTLKSAGSSLLSRMEENRAVLGDDFISQFKKTLDEQNKNLDVAKEYYNGNPYEYKYSDYSVEDLAEAKGILLQTPNNQSPQDVVERNKEIDALTRWEAYRQSQSEDFSSSQVARKKATDIYAQLEGVQESSETAKKKKYANYLTNWADNEDSYIEKGRKSIEDGAYKTELSGILDDDMDAVRYIIGKGDEAVINNYFSNYYNMKSEEIINGIKKGNPTYTTPLILAQAYYDAQEGLSEYMDNHDEFEDFSAEEKEVAMYLVGKKLYEKGYKNYEDVKLAVEDGTLWDFEGSEDWKKVGNYFTKKNAEHTFENLQGKTFKELAYKFGSGLVSNPVGIYRALKFGEDDVSYSESELVSQMIHEDLADDGAKLPDWLGGYSIGQAVGSMAESMGQMAPSMALGAIPVVGPVLSEVSFGMSAGGNAKMDFMREGHDEVSSTIYGMLVGGAEAGLQHLLGGVKLGNKGTATKIVDKFISGIKNGFGKYLAKVGTAGLQEGLEEGLQEVLAPVFELAVTGDPEKLSELEIGDVLFASLQGFMMGGGMSNIEAASENASYINSKSMDLDVDIVNSMLSEGLTKGVGTEAYKISSRINKKIQLEYEKGIAQGLSEEEANARALKKISRADFSELQEAVMSSADADTEVSIQNRLRELGEKENISALVQAIYKKAQGIELSSQEKSALKNSKYGQRVLNEYQNAGNEEYSDSWTEDIDGAYERKALGSKKAVAPVGDTASENITADTESSSVGTTISEPQAVSNTPLVTQAHPRGTAVALKEGGDVGIVGIASKKGNETLLRKADGTIVKASDVDFDGSFMNSVIEAAQLYDVNTGNAMLEAAVKYKDFVGNNTRTSAFEKSFDELVTVSEKQGIDFTSAMSRRDLVFPIREIGTGAARIAVETGLANYNARYKARQKKQNGNKKAVTTKKATVTIAKDVNATGLTSSVKQTLQKLATLAKADIVVENFPEGDEARGYYANGVIHLNARMVADYAWSYVAIHEAVHHLKAQNAEGYSVLEKYITNYLSRKGRNVDNMVKALQRSRAKYEKLSSEDALEEIVCNAMSDIATDEEAMAAFLELDESERKTLISVLRNIASKIREWARSLTGNEYRRLVTESEHLRHLANELNKQLKAVEGSSKVQNERRNVFEGYAEDGRGIYRSNFPIGTPKKAKAESILRYIKNVWSKSPIKLKITDANGVRYIFAEFDPYYDETGNTPTDASKLMGGNRHGNSSEQRVTLDLADDYYQIATDSQYNYSREETGKTTDTHKDVTWWHYFINDIYFAEFDSDEYTPYRVTINVKEKSDGHYVYSFSAEKQEEISSQRALHAVVNSGISTAKGNLSDEILSQPEETVKKNSYADIIDLSADYDNAVEVYLRHKNRYNLNKVREIVNNAASRSMPDSVVRDEIGRLLKVYHGTEAESFNVFDKARRGQTDASLWGRGYYFTPELDFATDFGENVRGFYLNITKPFVVDKVDVPASIIAIKLKSMGIGVDFDYRGMKAFEFVSAFGNQRFTDVLMEKGYDGVIVEDFEYVAFEQNQMKLADAITYDDNGDVIPLSERFADNTNDIRYSYNDESFRDIEDDIYYPTSARERSAFKRSMANKTSALQGGEIKSIIIYTADNFYIIRANGYLSGEIVFKCKISGNEDYLTTIRKEDLDVDTVAERFARLSEARRNGRRGSTRNNVGAKGKRGLTESDDRLDSGQSDSRQIGSDSTSDRTSQIKKSYSYADEDVDLWGLLDPEEENADSAQRSELLDGYIQTAGVLLEKTRNIQLTEGRVRRIANTVINRFTGKPNTELAEQIENILVASTTNKSISGYDVVGEIAAVMKKATTESEITVDDFRAEREEVYAVMHSFGKIYLTSDQIANLKDNDKSLVWFRGKLFGRVMVVNENQFSKTSVSSLEDMYLELSSRFPEWFMPDLHSSVMPMELLRQIEALRPRMLGFEEVYMQSADEIAVQMASDLLTRVIDAKYEQNKTGELRDLRRQNSDSRKKWLENQDSKKHIQNIERYASSMIKRIVSPTKTKGVPQNMQQPVLELLGAFDFTKGHYNRETGEPIKHDKNWADKMNVVAGLLDTVGTHQQTVLEGGYEGVGYMDVDPYLVQSMKEFAKTAGGKKLSQMSGEELGTLDGILMRLRNAISSASRLHQNALTAEVSELGENTIEEFRSKKRGRYTDTGHAVTDAEKAWSVLDQSLRWSTADAFTVEKMFGKYGGSVIDALYKGYEKVINNIDVIKSWTEKHINVKKVQEWRKDARRVVLHNGSTITLTIPQIMELYVLSKRTQAQGHIYGAGIVPEAEVAAKKLSAKNKDQRRSSIDPFKITEEDVIKLTGELSEEQKRLADLMQMYLTTDMAELGNEVTLKRFLYKAYKTKNYWPIKVLGDMTKTTDQTINFASLYAVANPGFSKNTIEGANNAIVIHDIFDSFSQHCGNMALMNGLSIPLSDALKWYNYTNNSTGVKGEMKEAFSKHANEWFVKFLSDLNNQQIKASPDTNILDSFIKKSKSASIWMNGRVVVQQFTAYTRAYAVLDAKYLANPQALLRKGGVEKALKYCPIAKWKSWGFFTTDIGNSLENIIIPVESTFDKIKSAGFWATAKADELTWGMLWNACELQVLAENSDLVRDTEECNLKTAELLTRVVNETQVVDTPFHRAQIRRNTDIYSKLVSSFMDEPLKSYNMLRNAMFSGEMSKKQRAKVFGRAFVSYLTTSVLCAVLESAWDVFIRNADPDDEDPFWKKYLRTFGENTLDNLIVFKLHPIINKLWSVAEGWSSSGLDENGIKTLTSSIKHWIKRCTDEDYNRTLYSDIYETAKAISFLTGIGVHTVIKDIVGVVNHILPAGQKISNTAPTKTKLAEEAVESLLLGDKEQYDSYLKDLMKKCGGNEADVDKLIYSALSKTEEAMTAYQAYTSGNKKLYEDKVYELEGKGFKFDVVMKAINSFESFKNSQLSKAVKAEKEGDLETKEAELQKLYDTGLTEEDIIEEYNELLEEEESEPDPVLLYDTTIMVNVLDAGDLEGFNEISEYLIDNGKSEDSIKSAVTRNYKVTYIKAYSDGNKDEMSRIKDILSSTGLYPELDDDLIEWVVADYKKQYLATDNPDERAKIEDQLYDTGK